MGKLRGSEKVYEVRQTEALKRCDLQPRILRFGKEMILLKKSGPIFLE
jgi:hypothetical protein